MLMESILVFIKLPPLVVIGTFETQGLRETMSLLGGCQVQALGGSRTKTSHSRLAAKMAAPSNSQVWK